MNTHLTWEYIKIQIKSLGIVYGRSMAAEKYNNKRILYRQLEEIEKFLVLNPNCETSLQEYNKIKQKLEIIIIAETEGARIRAGQEWAEKGEKCTKLF